MLSNLLLSKVPYGAYNLDSLPLSPLSLLAILLFFMEYQPLVNDQQAFSSALNNPLTADVMRLAKSVLLNWHLLLGTQNLFSNSRALDDV